MTIKPGAFRFNTDSMKLEIFRGADTGDYSGPIADVVAYGGTSLFWDDSPIGAFSLSNNNRTATTNDGNSGSYTNGDVYSTAIAAGNTYAWTLRVTNGDTTGGWYFTDSQTASGTHADQRNESSGNASGLRGGETGASTYGAYATANGTSSAQNQIALNSDVSPNGNKNIEFVVYRPSSGTGKVWIRAEGAGSWIGGGDPSNTSSTATIVLPDATTYFGFVQYDRSTAATFTLDIESSGGYYGPRLAGQWEEIVATSPEVQTGGTRAVIGGGSDGSDKNHISYVNIATTGNSLTFGTLTARRGLGGVASRTRGVFSGGYTSGPLDTMEFITIASTGNAVSFGTLTTTSGYGGHFSNSTRGVRCGGLVPGGGNSNTIDCWTIASTGTAEDFGDLTTARSYCTAGMASQTRGVVSGDYHASDPTTVMDFVTISTQGNSSDFGDSTVGRWGPGGASNSVRGIMAGGHDTPADVNTIDYITIPTLGNAQDFGDMQSAKSRNSGAASPTRAIFSAGGGYSDEIDYVQIMSTGNAIDFGNLSVGARMGTGSCSNGHGGL